MALVILGAGLASHTWVYIAVGIAGGYLIMAAAAAGKSNLLSRINNKTDISYGVYLYASPVMKLLLWFYPDVSRWYIALATMVASYILGLASYKIIEEPAMRAARRLMA